MSIWTGSSVNYSYRDPAIIAHVKFQNISGRHDAQWKWYNPAGKLYYQTDRYEFGPSQGYFVDQGSLWHKLSIKDEKASQYPGKWRVEIHFDGDLISSKQFNIDANRFDATYDVDANIPHTSMANPEAVAVVIGNRNYEHKDIPNVDYAHHDAEIIKKYLMQTMGYAEGNILLIKDAGKAKFEAVFGIAGNHKGELYDFIKPNRSDVFVYYSGHGAHDPDHKKRYVIPVDCDPDPDGIDFKGKAITVRSQNGPENCIINAGGNGRGFYFHTGEQANSIVSGFTITNGVIDGWGSGGGGISCEDWSSPTIENCIIRNNRVEAIAGGGGGIYCDNASPIIRNCTIVNNSAGKDTGGGIYIFGPSPPTITNSIFWNNSPGQIDSSSAAPNVTYSDIEDGFSGIGNINSDPVFSGAGIYSLATGSPCIDTGTASGAPDSDIAGVARPQGSGYNMGAYEYQ